jgi:hypothetical protein
MIEVAVGMKRTTTISKGTHGKIGAEQQRGSKQLEA